MTKFENYLKERNIPIDSLEANSIQEGVQWAINETIQWMEKQVYQDYAGAPFERHIPDYMVKQFLIDINK
jgi:hypothetical protein